MAEIVSIVYQTEKSEHKPPYRFSRIPVEQATLIADHGIEGDRKAGRSSKRQLNIMDYEIVQTLAGEGYQTDPGQLGEQLVVKGVNITALATGTRLQLGETATIEVTMLREPCSWFEQIQDQSVDKSEGRVGVMARVITGGEIAVGAPIKVLRSDSAL